MSTLTAFFPDICRNLTLTLAHFLWQGGVVASLAGCLSVCLRKQSAQSRYLVWLAAMVLMLACLPSTFVLLLRSDRTEGRSVSHSFAGESLDRQNASHAPHAPVAQRAVQSNETAINTQSEMPGPVGGVVAPGSASQGIHREEDPDAVWQQTTAWITVSYLVGLSIMLARLCMALWGGSQLRRCAVPVDEPELLRSIQDAVGRLRMRSAPVVAFCRRISAPVVIGVFRPLILLPVAFPTGLTPDHIRVLIMHELVHIRQYDHLVIVLQRMIESVLFFHPAVWIVSRRLSLERELVCDDLVLAGGEQRIQYAQSLLKAAEVGLLGSRMAGAESPVVLGAAKDKPSRLRIRIRRLLDSSISPNVCLSRSAVLAIASLPIACIFMLLAMHTESQLHLEAAEPAQPPAEPSANHSGDASAPEEKDAADDFVAQLLNDSSVESINALLRMDDESKKKYVPGFVAALKDENTVVRARAMTAIRYIGPPAKAAVPALIDELDGDEKGLHWNAATALGAIGPDAKAALPTLLRVLKEEGIGADAIGKIGADEAVIVPLLIAKLHSGEQHERNSAAYALGRYKSKADVVVPALIRAIREGNKGLRAEEWGDGQSRDVRATAAGALGEIGEAAAEAIPDLVRLCSDEDPRVRWVALYALGKIAPKEKNVAAALVKGLSDSDLNVRYVAVEALEKRAPRIAQAGEALIETMNDDDEALATNAAECLSVSDEDARAAILALAQLAADDNAEKRRRAALCLGQFRPQAEQAVPVVLPLVRQQNLDVRRAAMQSLRKLRLGTKEAVSTLISLLEDESAAVRADAASTLGQIERSVAASERAGQALVKALQDNDKNVQEGAAWALVNGHFSGNDVAIPVLIRILKEGKTTVARANAASAIGRAWGDPDGDALLALLLALKDAERDPQYASDVPSAASGSLVHAGLVDRDDVPALIAAVQATTDDTLPSVLEALKSVRPIDLPTLVEDLESDDFDVRRGAVNTMKLIGPPAVPALIESMKRIREIDHRRSPKPAAWALGELGKPAVPALIEALGHEDPTVRTNATYALATIGPEAKEAVAVFVDALDDDNDPVRNNYLRALRSFGLPAPSAVPLLIRLLEDKDPSVCKSAALALGAIAPDNQPAMEAIMQMLDDPRNNPRYGAVAALGDFGTKANSAQPKLLALLRNDEYSLVREAAVETLPKIAAAPRDVIPAVVAALNDSDWRVRNSAVGALSRLASVPSDVIPALTKALEDPHRDVRDSASRALAAIRDADPTN